MSLKSVEASHTGSDRSDHMVAGKVVKCLFAPFYPETEIIVLSTLGRNQSIFPKGEMASHRCHPFTEFNNQMNATMGSVVLSAVMARS